ncbi:hypothetical protein D0Z07_8487 [Hyphodiscus hymeniophilus]|uniref:Uncharacterized protein n=1 Tax=Hyphodiscus hymeniophilus TaxID=353542 RepID=A0A9P6VE23_9HELO|nr:hypothetical protein D0Z07_8487 [Hyphodiscus hymeniophilus]
MRATFLGLRTKTLESNNNQENTPTRPQPSRPPLRPPLQSRDHNAMPRNPPLTAKSGNAANNMASYDKQTRPLMPTLSSSAVKTANRTPLTPRVAGSAPPPASTPLSRRGTRLDNNGTPPVGSSREDLSTPVSAFLSNNITPRSGSRKSRVDSTNTTPTGTPIGTPAPSTEFSRIGGESHSLGLGILDRDIPKRHTVTFSPAVSDGGFAKSPGPSTADSKFFFASEAKSAQAPPKPVPQTKNAPTFFYANGDSIPPPQSSSSSAIGSSVGEERSQPKFFHANGTPDFKASSHFPPPKPSSIVSSTSRMTSPRLAGSPGTLSPPQRPVSPQKLNQHASIASLRNTPSLPIPLAARPQAVGRGQSANNIISVRKASIEGGQRIFSHGRSASVDSPESKMSRRISSGSSLESTSSPPPMPPLNLITTPIPVSTPEEISLEPQSSSDDGPSEVQSPIKTGHSLEHMNELAANARRERKVLDLEITNSSLAAINRTLEREMRKQTAELRRYRRLSRSGRLSIATTASMRSASGNLSIMEGVEGPPLSDMSEEDSETDSDFDSSESESLDDGSLSPGAMAESDLRHRKKDEKRLQLDLSKHQQLLIDSQKMNQSLKRCLGWTEELINEGKKALEYHVRVSDVELGGRVLALDEMEGDDEAAHGLGEVGKKMLKEARLAAANGAASWSVLGEGADRDSGIELDPDAPRQPSDGFMEMTLPPPYTDG